MYIEAVVVQVINQVKLKSKKWVKAHQISLLISIQHTTCITLNGYFECTWKGKQVLVQVQEKRSFHEI